MTRSMLKMEDDRDMWRKLFEDYNKKQYALVHPEVVGGMWRKFGTCGESCLKIATKSKVKRLSA